MNEIKNIIKARYGENNVAKVLNNLKNGKIEAKTKFLKEYPYANIDKFTFDVELDEKGNIKTYNTYYKYDDDGDSYDITSDTFLKNKTWQKDLEFSWQTIWGVKGYVHDFKTNTSTTFNPEEIKIYVSNDLHFTANLEPFKISYTEFNDITNNSYLASLYAAYIATYLCGISTQHFEYKEDEDTFKDNITSSYATRNKTPKIITSIARYHLYFTMKKFLRYPEKMKRYITKDIDELIHKHKPKKYIWQRKKFVSTHMEKTLWYRRQHNKHLIHNVRYARNTHGQIVGLYYDLITKTTYNSFDDYKTFIATESTGLTKLGQLLFQQSIESYVYSVLGAQASTRWAIVGKGAISIQTQNIFLKKVKDTIIQSDPTITLKDMRIAVNDTNVVLNLAISPGLILVPSNMIILDKKILGYNNILKIVKGENIKFGFNKTVNYFKPFDAHGVTTPGKIQSTTIPSSTKTNPELIKLTPVPTPAPTPSLTTSLTQNKEIYKQNVNYADELKLVASTIVAGLLIGHFLI